VELHFRTFPLVYLVHSLQQAEYVYTGWIWELNRAQYNTPEGDVYNEKILKQTYLDYNSSVIDYFEGNSEKFLVINIKEHNAVAKICDFLGVKSNIPDMPWESKT
jgi:hypothetical protein